MAIHAYFIQKPGSSQEKSLELLPCFRTPSPPPSLSVFPRAGFQRQLLAVSLWTWFRAHPRCTWVDLLDAINRSIALGNAPGTATSAKTAKLGDDGGENEL